MVFDKIIRILTCGAGTIAQYDHKDPTAATPEVRKKARSAYQKLIDEWQFKDVLHGLRIGIPQVLVPSIARSICYADPMQEYFPAELNASILGPVKKVVKSLRSRGATIIPVSLPSTRYALSAYYVIASAEASSNLARYDGIQYGSPAHVYTAHLILSFSRSRFFFSIAGLRVDPEPDSRLKNTADVYARTRSRGFGAEVQRRILLGTYALTAE